MPCPPAVNHSGPGQGSGGGYLCSPAVVIVSADNRFNDNDYVYA